MSQGAARMPRTLGIAVSPGGSEEVNTAGHQEEPPVEIDPMVGLQ